MRKTFWSGEWRCLGDDDLVTGPCDPPSGSDEVVAESLIRPIELKFGESCPACGARLEYATNSNCYKCRQAFGALTKLLSEEVQEPPPPPPRPPPGTREYKVLTQRDEFFKSKFNPESLQELINLHAAEGWRVVTMTATDVGSFLGSFWNKGGGAARQELVVLLERIVE